MKRNEESKTIGIRTRDEISDDFKWHVKDLYPSEEDWERDFRLVKEALPELKAFQGRLGRSGRDLLAFFERREEVSALFTRAYVYSYLKRDENTGVQANVARNGRIANLGTELGESLSFVRPEILEFPEETLRRFMEEEPGLALYAHALEDLLRMKEHTLSRGEESILAASANMARGPSEIFTALTNTDLTFPEIEDERGRKTATSNSLYYKYRGSRERKVRRANEEAYHGTYRKFRNTLASMMQVNISKDRFFANARGYPSCLEAALHDDNIPLAVYHNLIDAVNESLEPLHRYARLRKRILGVDELKGYDLYCSLFPSQETEIPYEEAREIVVEGLKPLGPEYGKTLSEGLYGGWVDVFENEGKRSGAYSTSAYGTHPFVLHNYHGRLNDVFTLAHEMGHAMHSFFTQTHQPYIYGDYPIFAAEVASTANEALLMMHLLKTTRDRAKKRYLLDFYLDQVRQTFYRQVLFSEFEWTIHREAEAGRTLTADLLEETFGGLFGKYYGPDLAVDEYKSTEWSRIPHFYRNFYVYTYATGISAGTAFARMILDEGEAARERYIREFLCGGSSDYAINLLAKAGVDMTSSEPIKATTGFFNDMLDELESLLEPEEK